MQLMAGRIKYRQHLLFHLCWPKYLKLTSCHVDDSNEFMLQVVFWAAVLGGCFGQLFLGNCFRQLFFAAVLGSCFWATVLGSCFWQLFWATVLDSCFWQLFLWTQIFSPTKEELFIFWHTWNVLELNISMAESILISTLRLSLGLPSNLS